MIYRRAVLVFIICTFIIAAAILPAAAKQFKMESILKEHKIYLVTTEDPKSVTEKLSNVKVHKVLTPEDYSKTSQGLKAEESVLFIIDRSKVKGSATIPGTAVGPEQVVVSGGKASGRNAWEIVLSAPSSKWLSAELSRFAASEYFSRSIDEKGTILTKYGVKQLLIVSTEDRDIASDWIQKQTSTGDQIEWDFLSADSWTATPPTGTDLLFLLDRQKISKCPVELVKSLPEDMQSWVADDSTKGELTVQKDVTESAEGSSCAVYAIIAPSVRQLRLALGGTYGSFGTFPDSFAKKRVTDLSTFDEVVVIARMRDRSDDADDSVLEGLSEKIASSLGNTSTGFSCYDRQDLVDLSYNAIQRGGANNPEQLIRLQKKLGRSCAVAILDVTAIQKSTSYVKNQPMCLSERYAPFDKEKPREPVKPNVKERKYGIAGPRIYSGEDDPKYKEALRKYDDEYEDYRRDIRDWEQDKRDDEERRESHEMDWKVSLDAVQKAKVLGELTIYDLSSPQSRTWGQAIFSSATDAEAESRSEYKSERVTVKGESRIPEGLRTPESISAVSNPAVITDILQKFSRQISDVVVASSLLPGDVLNRSISLVKKPAQVELKHITVEAIGATSMSSKPKGSVSAATRNNAINDACNKLVAGIKASYEGADPSVEDIRKRIKVVSEGWNGQTRQYRIKVKFDGDVSVAKTAD